GASNGGQAVAPAAHAGSKSKASKTKAGSKASAGSSAATTGVSPIIAASDYMKIVPDQLSPWLGARLVSLGTDGFGRSDNREHLRRHFEINAESIVAAALSRLARDGSFDASSAMKALKELGVDAEKA